ncbi:MAG: tRNA (N(6)-L-threonylcarbamoyladenosine(37)-C(2))-methylthiotransferase MtaB [Erysipelotrichaceae bacterium]|nr:tRNA (N(6)-L-threonylcarbamoyladenosine(37)-C(2))-methylthiotransferase MtaB [Erysipelotrichaceae bacterium]
MKLVKIVSLGCKVNQYESEAVLEQFKEQGYVLAKNEEIADVVIINTCSVTSVADSKSRQRINREIKENPGAIVCAMGCYSQVGYEVLRKIPGLSIIVGTDKRNKIYEYVLEYQKNKTQIVDIANSREYQAFENQKLSFYTDNVRVYLKIEDGCNNFCSYCIVPYTRGRVRSRKKEDVLEEAQRFAKNGYKELVLTGIHTAAYGQDLGDYNFDDLLEDLIKIKGIERIRISSIEDSEITDRFVQLIKEHKTIVNHIHIPLQSGCDTVLKRMNRKYNTEYFAASIKKLREVIPDIAITTDVIVGFPGETEEEFNTTYKFIKDLNLTQLHVFPYSIRQGTLAAKMPNQVAPQIKKERVKKLISLSDSLFQNYIKNYIGEVVEVLVESEREGYLIGHTTNYLKVAFKGDASLINQIVPVKIEKMEGLLLEGIKVSN